MDEAEELAEVCEETRGKKKIKKKKKNSQNTLINNNNKHKKDLILLCGIHLQRNNPLFRFIPHFNHIIICPHSHPVSIFILKPYSFPFPPLSLHHSNQLLQCGGFLQRKSRGISFIFALDLSYSLCFLCLRRIDVL